MMLHTVLFIFAVLVLLAGCAIVFIDVVVSYKTDHCQDAIPAEYIGKDDNDTSEANRRSGFFVLAIPEFQYSYKGKEYREKSANLFFYLYLKKGKLTVPFINGKTYRIYVNPSAPNMFITSAEQRVTALRILGCTVALLGMFFAIFVMRMPSF
jgi:hypothetical protein